MTRYVLICLGLLMSHAFIYLLAKKLAAFKQVDRCIACVKAQRSKIW